MLLTGAELANKIYSETNFDVVNLDYGIAAKIYQIKEFNQVSKWLVFPGSQTFVDWKVNLTLGFSNRQQQGLVKVHRGYNQAYKTIRQEIDSLFKDYTEPIYIVGHSSGGAIAQLAALHLSQRGHRVICITFASPKVGGQEFVQLCNASFAHFRIVNLFDLVPLVPLFGYQASGKTIKLNFWWRSHLMANYLKNIKNYYGNKSN
jgi:predicted lipase